MKLNLMVWYAMEKILIVDDEEIIIESYSKVLKTYGFKTYGATNSIIAVDLFKTEKPAVVLLDLKIANSYGIEILKKFKKINPQIPVIIVTAYDDINVAVEAIKLGAYDFINKPPEFEKLVNIIRRAIDAVKLAKQVEKSGEFLLGKSPTMAKIIQEIHQVADSKLAIVLQGERGTGKTFIANMIHNLSHCEHGPFIKVDLGAIPDTLLESELFGHEKGAFTGAEKKKKGYFQLADTGTIFISLLENMSPHIQSKLLGVIQQKQLFPIGSSRPLDTDFRLITSTVQDIKKSVKDNKLQEDLFNHIGEYIINIPPLRKRREDVPFFAHKFLLEANAELKKQVRGISDSGINVLTQHSWPGNIRELKSVIRRAVLFSDSDIIRQENIVFMDKKSQLEDNNEMIMDNQSLKPLWLIEREAIIATIKAYKGNLSKSVEILQISRATLYRKMRQYNIPLRPKRWRK